MDGPRDVNVEKDITRGKMRDYSAMSPPSFVEDEGKVTSNGMKIFKYKSSAETRQFFASNKSVMTRVRYIRYPDEEVEQQQQKLKLKEYGLTSNVNK